MLKTYLLKEISGENNWILLPHAKPKKMLNLYTRGDA